MTQRAKFRGERRMIYDLKRRHGVWVTLVRTTGDATDMNSGLETNVTVQLTIKAVVLPSKSKRDALYRQDYVTSARPFMYGGVTDTKIRHMLVAQRDIPSNWPIDLNSYVLLDDGTRWEVTNLEEYSGSEILGLDLKRMDGAAAHATYNINVDTSIVLDQNATHS